MLDSAITPRTNPSLPAQKEIAQVLTGLTLLVEIFGLPSLFKRQDAPTNFPVDGKTGGNEEFTRKFLLMLMQRASIEVELVLNMDTERTRAGISEEKRKEKRKPDGSEFVVLTSAYNILGCCITYLICLSEEAEGGEPAEDSIKLPEDAVRLPPEQIMQTDKLLRKTFESILDWLAAQEPAQPGETGTPTDAWILASARILKKYLQEDDRLRSRAQVDCQGVLSLIERLTAVGQA